MILKRQILLKAIVTERLKEQLIQDVEDAIRRVEEAQDELERQSRRMMLELQRTDLNRAMAFRQQLDLEKRKQEHVKAELQEQMKELHIILLNLKVITTHAKAITQALGEKPNRLIFSGKANKLTPEEEIIKSSKPLPAKKP